MLTTICFYITIGIIGLFGLALIVVSIASLVHNLRQNSRVKKYINEKQKKQPEHQYAKTLNKHNNQEHCFVNSKYPLVVTQTQDHNSTNVVIGYTPSHKTQRINQTVQANAGNKAEKQKKQVQNHNKVLSKYSRNNSHENKHGKFVPKYKIKNYNEYSKYNKYNHKLIFRAK